MERTVAKAKKAARRPQPAPKRTQVGLRLRLLPDKCVTQNRRRLPAVVHVDTVPAIVRRAPGNGNKEGKPLLLRVEGESAPTHGISGQHLRLLPPTEEQRAAGAVVVVVDKGNEARAGWLWARRKLRAASRGP